MPNQQQIIDAVISVIRAVTPASGYSSNLADCVVRDGGQAVALGTTLQVEVRRGEKSIPQGAEFGLLRRELEIFVLVEGRGATADNLVSTAIDDIEAALRSDNRLGGLARWVTFDHSAPMQGYTSGEQTAQQLTLQVGFIEN